MFFTGYSGSAPTDEAGEFHVVGFYAGAHHVVTFLGDAEPYAVDTVLTVDVGLSAAELSDQIGL